MKNIKTHIVRLIAVMLCVAAISVPAYAANEGYYSSDGKNKPNMDNLSISSGSTPSVPNVPHNPLERINISKDGETSVSDEDMDCFFDNVFSAYAGSDALTPAGNLSLVDDILQSEGYSSVENEQKSKQFITVQSKNGNYFYIIVDRSGEQENVYFLNMVDESDLLALIPVDESAATEPEPVAEPEPVVCTCQDKCYPGHVDTSCPICAVNMSECIGREPEPESEPEPEPEPQPVEPTETEEPETVTKGGITMKGSTLVKIGSLVIALIVAVLGGTAFYFLKGKGGHSAPRSDFDFDDEDFDDEDEDDEDEFEDEEEKDVRIRRGKKRRNQRKREDEDLEFDPYEDDEDE